VKPGVGHHEAQEMMEFCSHWVPCLLTGTKKHKMAWDCSPIHPTVQTWPPQTTTCSGPWKIIWEVTTTRLMRQSRKLHKGDCKELEWTSTPKGSLRLCNASRNAQISTEIFVEK
jgi:hypothetical protein